MHWEHTYYSKALHTLDHNKIGGKKIEKVIELIKSLLPGSNLLDIGCGEASLVEALPKKVSYVGIDPSEFAIANAKKKYNNNSDVLLKVANSDNLPFSDKTFDLVISYYSLEHFSKPKKSLNEMLRVLKEGGILIICAPNLEFPFSYPSALRFMPYTHRYVFLVVRLKDYLLRLFGFYSFRTIPKNFLEHTGRYEKGDDDLRHLVSGHEVAGFLKRRGFKFLYIHPFPEGKGINYVIRKFTHYLPGLHFFGREFFIMARK